MGLQSLDISKRQSAEGIEPRQAEGIASAIVLAAAGSSDSLATKQDLDATRSELKRHIADVKAELHSVRAELKRGISELRTELKTDIQNVRGEMSTMKSDLMLAIEKTRNQMILSIAGIAGLVLLFDRLLG